MVATSVGCRVSVKGIQIGKKSISFSTKISQVFLVYQVYQPKPIELIYFTNNEGLHCDLKGKHFENMYG